MKRYVMLLMLLCGVCFGTGITVNRRAVSQNFRHVAQACTTVVRHDDGTETVYQAVEDTDAARGTALLAALAAAASGETVELGPGTYNIATTLCTIPAGVTLKGAGKYTTHISSSKTTAPSFTFNDGSSAHDLQLSSNYDALATYIILAASSTAKMFNCYITGYYDAIYLSSESSVLYLYDCEVYSKYDAVVINANSSKIYAYNSKFTAEFDASYGGYTSNRVITLFPGKTGQEAYFYDCQFYGISTRTAGTFTFFHAVGVDTGTAYCYNCVSKLTYDPSKAPTTGPFDFKVASGHSLYVWNCIGSRTTGELYTGGTGTVTYLSNTVGNLMAGNYYTYNLVKTVKKTLGWDGATGCDFVLTSAANHTQQNKDLGAIVPAFARIIDITVICTEALAPDDDMTFAVGNASAGEQFIAAAQVDDLNNTISTATGTTPIVAINTAASNVWIGADPAAGNFEDMTAGKWSILVTYIDNTIAK